MPINKLLVLPYGSYLMVRLDYKIICGDELEAKIMRIIEMYMDDERRQIYRNLLNDPQNNLDPNAEVEITKDVWAAISHRLFKNDLYDQDMSENTLKKAIKSLVKKKFIKVRDDRTKRYEAPKYQINTDVVQGELNTLSKIGKTEYQKLMVSKIDGIKNSSHQNETPSEYQKLMVSPDLMVSKIDPNSRRVTDTVDSYEEEDTLAANSTPPSSGKAIALPTHAQSSEDEPYQPDFTANQDREKGHSNGQDHATASVVASPVLSTVPVENVAGDRRGSSAVPVTAQQTTPVAPELSTLSVSSPQASAKLAPKQEGKPSSKVVASGKRNIPAPTAQFKSQLTLLGGQAREWYEIIRACRLRLTANNVKALNVLGDLDGMTFENLKETIETIDDQDLVKSKNIPIGPQELASEEGYWRFDKWLPVVVRNRQRQASQSAPPKSVSSLPSYHGMSDEEYYASLRGGNKRERTTNAR